MLKIPMSIFWPSVSMPFFKGISKIGFNAFIEDIERESSSVKIENGIIGTMFSFGKLCFSFRLLGAISYQLLSNEFFSRLQEQDIDSQ